MKKKCLKLLIIFSLLILLIDIFIPSINCFVDAAEHLSGDKLLELNGKTIKILTTVEEINNMFGKPKVTTNSYFGGKEYSYTDSNYSYYLFIATDEDGMIKEYGTISNNFKATRYSAGERDNLTSSHMSGTVLSDNNSIIYGVMEYVEMSNAEILDYFDVYKSNVSKYLYSYQKHFEIAAKVNGKIRGKEFTQTYLPEDIFLISEKLHENNSNLEEYAVAAGKTKYIDKIRSMDNKQLLSEMINPIFPLVYYGGSYHTTSANNKYFLIDIHPTSNEDRKYKMFDIAMYDIDPGFLQEEKKIELTSEEKSKLAKAKASYNSFITNRTKVGNDVYKTKPTYKTLPLVKGVYKDEALQMAVDFLNIARNGIGIQEVKLNKNIASAAEAKAILLRYAVSIGAETGHNMSKPAGVDSNLYNEAMTYMNENLFIGNIYTSIIAAISDSLSSSGPANLGHRYNLLNYSLNLFGMASCENQGVHKLSRDSTSSNVTPQNVAWPPEGIMPCDLFQTGYWSIRFYKDYKITSDTTVHIKWLNTGREYDITKNGENGKALVVDGNQLAFYDSSIIHDDGDVFEITINNLTDTNGKKTSYTYRTCFVDFNEKTTYTEPTDIKLSTTSVSLNVGDTKIITAKVLPENAKNKLVTWKSQNENIVKVKQDGTIQAISAGTTKVLVTCSNITKEITITVGIKLPFNDVKNSDWFYKAVKYVYENNIIKGYNTTTFAPNDKVTRGMLVTILYRMEGEPKISGNSKFPDVQDSKQYYYKAVKWATDNKIVSGYNTGKFGPNDNITREQLAVILNKYARYKKKDVSPTNNLSEFKDGNKVSSYAVSQMKWAVGAGVITGNDDRTLKPQGTATRAEVSAMLEKYCKKVGR